MVQAPEQGRDCEGGLVSIVEIPIPVPEAEYIIRLLERERNAADKQMRRKNFVPAPGRRNADEWKVKRLDELLALFREYV